MFKNIRTDVKIGIFPIPIACWSGFGFSSKIGVIPTKSGWLDSLYLRWNMLHCNNIINAFFHHASTIILLTFFPWSQANSNWFLVVVIILIQKTIKCQNLNTTSSVFTELGRRVTSFIFGSQPASHEATVSFFQKLLLYLDFSKAYNMYIAVSQMIRSFKKSNFSYLLS